MSIKSKPASAWNGVGSLRVLEQDSGLNYEVQIDVMRSGLNENGWDFRNVGRYARTFAGTPILCAYVGNQVGDGHNMRESADPQTGARRYSFMDPTAERIVGTIYDTPESVWTEERNGERWVVAKRKLWRFYNPELVDKIAAEGHMDVSAETDVTRARKEADRDIYEQWRGIGVTILGDLARPAIPGAHIRAMEALQAEFQALKLRAASLQPDSHPNRKGVNRAMSGMSNKRILSETQQKFGGYRILDLSEDGTRVMMLDPTGSPCVYQSREEDHGVVIPDRIKPLSLSASYTFEDGTAMEVDVMRLLSDVGADASARAEQAMRELETVRSELSDTRAQLTAMAEAEHARRIEACEARVSSAVKKAQNAGLGFTVEDAISTPVMEEIKAGKYANACDAEGKWIGDKLAEDAIMAKIGRLQLNAAEAAAAGQNQVYAWESHRVTANSAQSDEGLAGVVARISN